MLAICKSFCGTCFLLLARIKLSICVLILHFLPTVSSVALPRFGLPRLSKAVSSRTDWMPLSRLRRQIFILPLKRSLLYKKMTTDFPTLFRPRILGVTIDRECVLEEFSQTTLAKAQARRRILKQVARSSWVLD